MTDLAKTGWAKAFGTADGSAVWLLAALLVGGLAVVLAGPPAVPLVFASVGAAVGLAGARHVAAFATIRLDPARGAHRTTCAVGGY